MKKITSILLLICFALPIFLFTACTEKACTHEYIELVNEVTFFEDANCTSPAKYYKSCKICGELSTEIFTYGKEKHFYLDGDHCVVCEKEKPLYEMYIVDEDVYMIYIEFGSFPQTEVKNENTVASLNSMAGTLPTTNDNYGWTSYDFYAQSVLRNDIAWYKDVVFQNEKFRAVYFNQYRPSRTQYECTAQYSEQDDHGYQTNKVYWFRWEPIVWRAMYEDGYDAFLIGDRSLYSMSYYYVDAPREIDGETIHPNNYEHSDVRAWLNEEFFEQAFNQREKDAITEQEIDNSAPTTNLWGDPTHYENGVNKYVCENTYDKIFMPSMVDVTNTEYGFSNNDGDCSARCFKATDYARALGCSSFASNIQSDAKKIGNSYAWTRSPQSYYHFGLRRVDPNGAMQRSTNIDFSNVAPIIALYVDMQA